METNKIIKELYYCADAWEADPDTCREAANVISQQRRRIAELEEDVIQQRKRANEAESFICKLCAECDWKDHSDITVMQKKCCSWFPECGKFSLRQRWISVTERLPDSEGTFLVRTATGMVTSARFYDERDFPARTFTPAYHRPASWQANRNVTHWMPLPEPPKE